MGSFIGEIVQIQTTKQIVVGTLREYDSTWNHWIVDLADGSGPCHVNEAHIVWVEKHGKGESDGDDD